MELVFIWVDKFRNFVDLGINISYNHKINFNYKKKLLDIKTINNDISLIFDENILNITGLIGKNSTGKSNLLDLICYTLKGNINSFNSEFLAIFRTKENNKHSYYIHTNILNFDKIKCNEKISYSSTLNKLENLNIIFFSNIIDGRDQHFPKTIIDLSQNNTQTIFKKSDIYNQFKFILSDYFNKTDLDLPTSIMISTRIKTTRYNRDDVLRNLNSEIYYEISNKYKSILRDTSPINHLRYSFRFSLLSYILNESLLEMRNRKNDLFEVNPDKETLENLLQKELGNSKTLNIKDLHVKIEKFISLLMFEFTKIGNIQKDDMLLLLDFDKAIESLDPKITKELKYNQSKIYYEIELTPKNISIFKHFMPIFNLNKVIELDWVGISSGHKAFLNLFAQLHSVNKKVNNLQNILICIDEGDLYLHPKWQQEFLFRLLNFIPSIYKNKIQIILTSHSPFLVSDLPRENLIFMDKNEDSTCKIINYKEIQNKTFGANIIDLYVDAFLLDKGTISNFALDIIKKTIAIAKSENASSKDIKYAKSIKDLIGDKVISYKLNQMLNKDVKN